jgi:hypothetical protein
MKKRKCCEYGPWISLQNRSENKTKQKFLKLSILKTFFSSLVTVFKRQMEECYDKKHFKCFMERKYHKMKRDSYDFSLGSGGIHLGINYLVLNETKWYK